MFSRDDTIVGVATPPGRGGIGVVRLSGPDAVRVGGSLLRGAPALEPRRATFARLHVHHAARGLALEDQVVVTWFAAPHSYTGEDVVEVSAHGSPVVLAAIVEGARRSGARLAEPGEFTLRAFLNGRVDLVQAEAVADLVDAVTPLQARVAFDQLEGTLTREIGRIEARLFELMARMEASIDFPEEGFHFAGPADVREEVEGLRADVGRLLAGARRGRIIREGRQVVILGKANVGKSSLFNALVGCERAIVTPAAGTTRDLVTEEVELEGLRVRLVDTAGMRETREAVEAEGVERARAAGRVADAVLVVLDGSAPLDEGDRRVLRETAGRDRLVVVSKADVRAEWDESDALGTGSHGASARDRTIVNGSAGAPGGLGQKEALGTWPEGASEADRLIVNGSADAPAGPDRSGAQARCSNDASDRNRMVVGEAERPAASAARSSSNAAERVVRVSSVTGEGMAALRERLRVLVMGSDPPRDVPFVSNLRQAALLERAAAALERAGEQTDAAGGGLEELILADLQDAHAALEEVTGKRSSEALLHEIFSRFCIGK